MLSGAVLGVATFMVNLYFKRKQAKQDRLSTMKRRRSSAQLTAR
ncbi:phage holin [Pectobacterium parmentieri]